MTLNYFLIKDRTAWWQNLLNYVVSLNITEISHQHVAYIRWGSGTVAVLLSSSVLQSYGFTMYLLPWISAGIILHAVYGYLISKKKTKVLS